MADTASTTIQFTTIEELFKWTNYVSLEISSPSKVHADKLYYQKHIPTIHPKVFSPKDFAEIEKERGLRRRKFRFRRYEAKSKILIITSMTKLEMKLSEWFYTMIGNQQAVQHSDLVDTLVEKVEKEIHLVAQIH